jgi:hypothetical protein
MPYKHNEDRRHHIPKMAFKVQNWPEYEAGLRRRGSLTLWIEDAALDHWQTVGPGGQARYKDAAIQTTLMVRTAFSLALRQAEGLMASVITLMDLTISAPDHTTISRRAVTLPVIQAASVPHGPLHLLIDSSGLQVYGAGQWLEAKHGVKSRRKWRKLHLAVDADNGTIVAQTLTDQDTDDPSQVAPLLDQIDGLVGRVTADGAYDGAPTYETIAAHGDDIEVVIPPRSSAVLNGELGPLAQRDRHLEMITERGRLAESNRLRQTIAGRNDDGPLQGADRISVASARLRRTADRGSHQRRGPEPDAGGRTPGLRPSHARHRLADRGGGHCVFSPACAPTPS